MEKASSREVFILRDLVGIPPQHRDPHPPTLQVVPSPAGQAPAPLPQDGSVSGPTHPPSLNVFLAPTTFCLCWWLVLGLHVVLGGFALTVTALNRYLQYDDVATAVSALRVPKSSLQMTARSFFLVGLAHFVAIVRLTRNSVRARRLVFAAPKRKPHQQAIPSTPVRSMRQRLAKAYESLNGVWEALFSTTGFFGFSGPNFEQLFMLREGLEIVMQTYQAYQLSQSVPRKWVNQLAVASIVLNCVGSPLVHVLCPRKKGLRRMLNNLQDAALDFCCSVVIPVCVFLPYARVYNRKKGFPDDLLMNDAWFVGAVTEVRQVLVTSFPDFVSTIMPQINLLGYLMTAKNVLRRRNPAVQPMPTPDPTRGPVAPVDETPNTVKIRRLRERSIHLAKRLARLPRDRNELRRWWRLIAHSVFLAWGCTILGLHLDAVHNTSRHVPGCQLHVSSWSSSGFPCSVMLLNCHMSSMRGAANETAAVLSLLERSTLQVLVFSHCPALEIPPVTTEFVRLSGVETFNCSLIDWPMEAALREVSQPDIGYVSLVMTNWTVFPPGLLHNELPTQLTYLIIAANNMTSLPDNIGDVWSTHEWITISLERAPNLTTFPSSLCKLKIQALVIANTDVETVTPDCLENMGLAFLLISASPFSTVPALDAAGLQNLYMERTNITELPDAIMSMLSNPSLDVSFFGSPVCNSTQLHEGTPNWTKACRTNVNTSQGIYPWDIMLHLRPFEIGHPP